jgi:hypothetical protein
MGLAKKRSERKAAHMRKEQTVNDFLAGGGEMGASRENTTGQKRRSARRNMAAKSSSYVASRSHLAPPDVHLVGTGTHPVL